MNDKKPVPLQFFTLADDGQTPVPCDFAEWMAWNLHAHRHLFETEFEDMRLSTVFIGIDSTAKLAPLLFESKIFGGVLDGAFTRCSSYEEAEAQHREGLEYMCRIQESRRTIQ